jgi:hypothetical protein
MGGWFTAAKSKTAASRTPPAKREIRVFVSSTFRDLREEREYLVKHIFPQVRARCEERAVSFVEVDLRWGITEEQAQGDGALEICLSEIEQCLPFFIGLLGERYGWVPSSLGKDVLARHPWLASKRGRSITELEFLHRLQQTQDLPETVFFYFRDPKISKPLTESQTQDERTKLAALKRLARKSGLPVRENFASPQALGECVLSDLMTALDRHFPAKAVNDPLSAEMARQLAFASRQSEVFIARGSIVQAVTAHIGAKTGPLLLEGSPGIGKSTLLAHVATSGASGDLVLATFAAATPVAGNLDTMLHHVAAGMKHALSLQRGLPEDPSHLRRDFGAWLEDAASALRARKLLLIVDGIDQLLTEEGVPDVSWIPNQLPHGVSLLLSASDAAIVDELRRRNIACLKLTDWNERERNALANLYLARFAKALSRDLLREVVRAPPSANPLFLRILLEELRRHAEHETLPALARHYMAAADAAGLYDRILERYESDYERDRPKLVRDAMRYLAAARNGLSEHELLSILGAGEPLPHAFWSPLYLALSGAFVDRGATLRFAHQSLRDAVERRYFRDDASRREAHSQLARFFGSESSPVSERRRLEELTWQLARAGDWTRLGVVLADPAYLVRAWKQDRPDLLVRLNEWARGTSKKIVDLFAPVVSAPASYSTAHVGAVAQILVRGPDKRAGIVLQDHLIDRLKAGGDRDDLAVALNNRALTADDEGDHARALALRVEQRRILEGEDDGLGAAAALVNQARSHIAQGQTQAAVALLDAAIGAGAAGQRPIVLAFAYGMQADLARQQGDIAGAHAKYQQFESFSRRARHLPGIIEANIAFAEMAAVAKNFAEADARLKMAADIAAESGDAIHEGQARVAAARVAAERGDPLGAAQSYDLAIAAYERAGAKHLLSETLANKGMVLILARRFDEAASVLAQAESLARVTSDTRSLMQALSGQGVVSLELGDNAKAYEFFAAQANLARAQDHYQGLRAALGNMVIAAARLGDGATALRALDEEIALCLSHGDTEDAQELRRTRQSILTG